MALSQFIRFFLIFLFGCYQNVSAIVFELDNSNFDETVNGRAMVLVMFYAPWCGACKKALPVLSEVSALYEHHEDVFFARVNGFEERILSLRFDINSFPTVLAFPYQLEPVKFKDRVITEDLRQFVRAEILKNEDLIKAGKKKRGEVPPRPKVLPKMEQNIQDLTLDQFREIIRENKKHVLVSLYAPGCTDGCYMYAQVAETFQNEDSIAFVSLDFTTDVRITKTFNVRSNPSLYWFARQDKEKGSLYGGDIEALQLVDFINQEAGLARELGGTLKPGAGRIPEVDKILRESMNDILTGTRMDGIIAQVNHEITMSKQQEKYSKIYLDILEQVQEGKDVDDVVQEKFDLINNKMQFATTKKENEELIKRRNIVGIFIDIASEMEPKSGDTQSVTLPEDDHYRFHDEL